MKYLAKPCFPPKIRRFVAQTMKELQNLIKMHIGGKIIVECTHNTGDMNVKAIESQFVLRLIVLFFFVLLALAERGLVSFFVF